MRTPESVAGMLCPVCQVSLAMSDRQGIEIDYCPQCRGVWLDRGELDKIIERNAASEAPQASQATQAARAAVPPQAANPWGQGQQQRDPYRDDRGGHHQGGYDQRHGKPKRKKSFFEELFD